jgi:hypothetical protein
LSSIPTRVDALEQAMAELARAQVRTQQNLDQLADQFAREMREFKDEMRAFKDDRLAAEARMDRRWGELANKMGTLAEDIVAPGIPAIFQRAFGHTEEPNTTIRSWRPHRTDPSRRREFDVLAFARDVLLVTETKSQLRPEDLPAFEELLREAREYIPDAEGRRVVGALATFYVDQSLVRAGERQGFFMLGLSRGLMEILNAPGFRPREF